MPRVMPRGLIRAAMVLLVWVGAAVAACSSGAPLSEVIGVTHVNGQYHLTEKDFLNEGADHVLALGSRVIKVWFHKPAQSYSYNSDWVETPTLVDIARSPYYRSLFAKPFKTYILMVFSTGRYEGYFRQGMTEAQKADERRQFHELAAYLLRTYKDTGKTFVLQHWEGDWLIRGGFDAAKDPEPVAIQGMIDWLNARQEGVRRARGECRVTGVRVYHAAEVNRVVDSMRHGRPNMVNRVLPHTTLDLVSYSAWDSVTAHYDTPHVLSEALDFIAAHAPDSPDFGDKNVYLGEFGMPQNEFSPDQVRTCITNAVRTAMDWGCPYIVYWQVYCNELAKGQGPAPVTSNDAVRGFWLIRPDGSTTWTWDYLHGLLNAPDTPRPVEIPQPAR
ncbi:MAG TPA: hypothetical protein ENN87_06205 [Phycisphaerales bacterium]|nr:hypothetical protein [Phycisphaerales bacterium]